MIPNPIEKKEDGEKNYPTKENPLYDRELLALAEVEKGEACNREGCCYDTRSRGMLFSFRL